MAPLNVNREVHGSGGLGINPPDEKDLRQFFGRNVSYYLAEYYNISENTGTSRAFSLGIGLCFTFCPVVFLLKNGNHVRVLNVYSRDLVAGFTKGFNYRDAYIFALLASLANYVYITRSVGKPESIYDNTLTQMQREDAMLRRGGTSFSAYAVSLFILALAWGGVPRGEGGIAP